MKQNPHVLDHTSSRFMPGSVGMGWGRTFDGTTIQVAAWPVAHNFLRFFNIPIIEGNDFFEHNEKGTNRYVFNKKTVDKFGLIDPIGKELDGYPVNSGTVVGISDNANYAALYREIEPLVFICGDDTPLTWFFLKIDAVETPATIEHIKNVFSKFSTNTIDLRFLDEEIGKMYQKESNLANIISLFSLIAIIISLMGIYGLIVFNAKFKVREIGIRKVNGATEMEIVLFLNKGFIKLIVLAFVMATPVSYYMVSQWLKGFPYHVPIYWWIFALAGALTLLITLVTVSYQSWKAARQNPGEIVS
jgi:putative ABC transport system permease protein